MANVTPRKDKDGNIISYQIRVFRGRDAAGKKLKDYIMTWKPTPGMTKRQIEKEVVRQATLFEENCKLGNISMEKPTFEMYSAYVVDLKIRNGLKAKTASIYRALLKRINAEIGPLKVQDIRPDHLNRFYAKLAEPGQRKDKDRAKPRRNIGAWLKENGVSQQELAKRARVGHTSVGAVIQGKCICFSTAEKIAQAMGGSFSDFFTVEKNRDTVLSPKTILEHHRVISTVLEQAVREQLIPDNAAKRATPPKLPKHEMDAFELEEIRDILTALEEEPLKWQVCTHLLIATGARRGEIMGLRWKNVDWDNHRLYLCENRVYTTETGAISTTLKTGENRYVSVSSSVIELLRRWEAEQAKFFRVLGVTPTDYIMTADDGQPMHPDSPTDWLAKFAKRHGLPPIHLHKFRHTQASLLISEGVDILTVSKRLGHAKVSTTLDIYSHVLAKSDEKASETLDDLIYKRKE